MSNKPHGFTLIELIVAVAVLAILIAIALPSYTSQTLRANRSQAIDELLRQTAFQQREYTINNSFTAVGNFQTSDSLYRIRTLIDDNGQAYRIRAIPLNGQTEDGCGRLEINNLGLRTANGGNNARCWAGRNP